MKEPPDHTAEFSAANLLSFCGMIVPKYCLTRSSCSRRPESMSRKSTPLGQVFLQLVVDDLRLVLRAHAGEVFLLGLRNAELVPGVEDLGRQVLPALGLLLGRADVVVDVLEIDVVQVSAPLRQRPCEEVVERLVTELAHPGRLVLVLRDRLDDLVRDAAARLEEIVLRLVRVGEAVLVLLADLLDGLSLGCR